MPPNSIDLGDHNGTSMTWSAVNLAAGTQVLLSLEDADGDEAWSGNVCVVTSPMIRNRFLRFFDQLTVAASNSTSCLPGAAVSSAVASASSATPSPVTT